MARPTNGSRAPSSVQLSYQLLRTTTSPDEVESGVKSYVANLSALDILNLGTKENLRGYIAEYNPKKRNRVHDAIRRTIESVPARFITRNSGLVICALSIHVDDDKKTIRLKDASIINGAQTQGEIRRWVKDEYGEGGPDADEPAPFFIRAELIVDPDPTQVVETAIARNMATPVKSISQAGARGHLDELEKSIQKRRPDIKIRKSETDEDVYDTRKILQITRLLMPFSVSQNETASEKLRAYKNPEQCLTDFSDWHDRRHEDEDAKAKYNFTIQIAPYAIEEYDFWERHDGWNGHNLWEETKKGGRACRRDKYGKIVWVSPGLMFPIVGALSEFVVKPPASDWRIDKPPIFKPSDMIKQAVAQFRSADSDPMQMGRSAGAYDALRIYPSTLVAVMNDMKSTGAAGHAR